MLLGLKFLFLPDMLDFHLLIETVEDVRSLPLLAKEESYKELEGPADLLNIDEALDSEWWLEESLSPPSGVEDTHTIPWFPPLITTNCITSRPPRELGVPKPESQKLFDKFCTCCVNRF